MATSQGRNPRATRSKKKTKPVAKVTRKSAKPPAKKTATKAPAKAKPVKKTARPEPAKKAAKSAQKVQSAPRKKPLVKQPVKKTAAKAEDKVKKVAPTTAASNGKAKAPAKTREPVAKPEEIKAKKSTAGRSKKQDTAEPVAPVKRAPMVSEELTDSSEEEQFDVKAVEEDDFFADSVKPRSKTRPGTEFDEEEDFLDEFDEDAVLDEDVIIPDAIELDPLDVPIDLLDPDLIETPPARPAAPPKPKPNRNDRRQQKCDSCGGMYGWLSVERLCFNCLKKKIAAKKREEEGYTTGFGSGGGGGGGGGGSSGGGGGGDHDDDDGEL